MKLTVFLLLCCNATLIAQPARPPQPLLAPEHEKYRPIFEID